MGLKADAPCVGRIDELVSYFEERWLNGHYPLKTWNYYQMEGPKTNNHVEGWHNKINRAAGKAHPNIFELVELFMGVDEMGVNHQSVTIPYYLSM